MAKAPIISIRPPNIDNVSFDIYGTQPLIQHKWSEKAKKQMLDKQMKKAPVGKEPKDPEQDFRDSLYLCSDGQHPMDHMDSLLLVLNLRQLEPLNKFLI